MLPRPIGLMVRHGRVPPHRRARLPSLIQLSPLLLVLALLLFRCADPLFAQGTADVTPLVERTPIERGLPVSGIHVFDVTLTAAQFAKITVDQGPNDLTIAIIDPGGTTLEEIDGRFHGPEPVALIAQQEGRHRIQVRAAAKSTIVLAYTITLEVIRRAESADEDELAAERAATRGKRLLAEGTGEARRSAIAAYQQAVQYWRQVRDQFGEASALNSIGYLHNALGENRVALPYYGEALTIWRASGYRLGEAEVLGNIAAVRSALGDKQEALALYREALVLKRALNDSRGEAVTLANLSGIHYTLGNSRDAADCVALALPLFRMLGDHAGEAAMLNMIATIASSIGEKHRALEALGQMLDLGRAHNDARAQSVALLNLAGLFLSLGDHETALINAQQALVLVRTQGDRRTEAYILARIAQAYQASGDAQRSLEAYEQTLTLARTVDDRYLEAVALNNAGFLLSSAHDYSGAEDHYRQAISIIAAIGDPRVEAATLSNFGQLHHAIGEHSSALTYYTRALAIFDTLEDGSGKASVLFGMARISRDTGLLEQARREIDEALTIVESSRASVSAPDLRASYFASKQPMYELNIDLLMELHRVHPMRSYDRAALQASERARARSLLDTLTEVQADLRYPGDQVLAERERSLRQEIDATAARQSRLLSAKSGAQEIAKVRSELSAQLAERQQLLERLRAESPKYAALTTPRALEPQEIQVLLEANTRMLEFALGEKRSFLWVISPKTIASFELPGRAEIEKAARRVCELLATNDRTQDTDRQYAEEAEGLSRMVLGPAAGAIDVKRLLVVADGVLQYVPFGALPVPTGREKPRGQPLATNHEIIMLPSAAVLAVIRRDLERREPAPKSVAVLADPVFRADDRRVQKSTEAVAESRASQSSVRAGDDSTRDLQRSAREIGLAPDGQFSRLPSTRREAQEIVRLAKPGSALLALDFDANLTTAMSPELRQYRIVHFATHGVLNSVHPELSGLVLSLVDGRGTERNGFLRLQDIYNLDIPADLVVLSACQTGLGKEVKGEGIVGLTRGFMYAGASRVIVSLWNVDDEATAELMQRLYQRILGNAHLSPAAALQAAQMDVASQPRWRSPHYWAGFVLFGEPR